MLYTVSFLILGGITFSELKLENVKQKRPPDGGPFVLCGGGGIRTPDTIAGMPVFKTGAFAKGIPLGQPLCHSSDLFDDCIFTKKTITIN